MVVSHLSEDEQTIIEVLREIALEKIAPRAAEIDHTAQFPWDMKELLAQQDILAMPFPTESNPPLHCGPGAGHRPGCPRPGGLLQQAAHPVW